MAGVVPVALIPSPPSSSAAAAGAIPKLGPGAGAFRSIVTLPLFLHHSPASSSCSRIVCLKSFETLAAFSGYSITEDGKAPAQQNAASEELSIAALGIDIRIVEALARKNIINLFPIQRAVFQPAMQGRDLIGRAKTGTGKTLAFGIPILDSISREKQSMLYRPPGTPRSIILAPTRELAKQVENELVLAAPHLSVVCIYGGVSIEGQRRQLSGPVDVVVGTPGRVIDMLERGALRLNEVKIAILDEADQMLAVGFAEEVERIMQKLPLQRQTMLFSATMPAWIRKITSRFLNSPTMIDLVGENEDKIAEGIKLYAISTTEPAKNRVLGDLLTVYAKGGKAIVFTKTKKDTDDVAAIMSRSIGCEALHGDISQYQREKTLSGFRDGRFSVLVATDVASRGLDIPNVDLIVHYEVPNDSETFVHRSGRTGRAGKTGTCILMYTLSQKRVLRTIEAEVGCKFESIGPPAVEEVLASSSDHATDSIKSVQPEVARLFLPAAEKLLKEQGVHALAAAMAHVSGVSKLPPKRSLLTHEEGFMTLQITGEHLVNSSAFSSALMQMSPKAGMSMGRVSMLSSPLVKGGVFDLPEAAARELLSLPASGNITVTELKVLPDLEEDLFQQSYDRFGRGRSFNGGFRSGGSSYGGGGGGYNSSSNRSGYGSFAGSGAGSQYGYSRSGSGYGGSSYGSRTPSYGSSSYGGGGSSSYNNMSSPYDNRSPSYDGPRSSPNFGSSGGGYGRGSGSYGNPSSGYGGSPGYYGGNSPGTGYSAPGAPPPPSSPPGYGSSPFRSLRASGNSSASYGDSRSLPASGNSSASHGDSGSLPAPGTGYTGSSSSSYGYGGSSSAGGYGGSSPSYGGSSGGFAGNSSGYSANPTTPNASNDFGWKKNTESSRQVPGNLFGSSPGNGTGYGYTPPNSQGSGSPDQGPA